MRVLRAALVILAVSQNASAQRPDTVRVGYPLSSAPTLPLQELTALSMVARGQRTAGPTSSQDMLSTVLDGEAALLTVQGTKTPRGTMVDSVWSDPRTLAPLKHVASGFGRNVLARFTNGQVEVLIKAEGKPDSTVRADATRRFDFSIAGEVMTRLPLKVGYHATLQTYDVEQGPRSIELRVVGDTAVSPGSAPIPVFTAELDFGTHTTIQYLDKQTRRSVMWLVRRGATEMWGTTSKP